MAKVALYFTLLIWFLIPFSGIAQQINSEKDENPPLNIKYGIYLIQFDTDFKLSTFDADFYWWLSYNVDSARLHPDMSDTAILNFEFTNCENCHGDLMKDAVEDFAYRHTITGDSIRYVTGRTKGTYHFEPDYSSYPFDSQVLVMEFEHAVEEKNKINLEVDTSSYPNSNHKSGKWWLSDEVITDHSKVYHINTCSAFIKLHEYKSEFGDPRLKGRGSLVYSRVIHQIIIERNYSSHVWKIIIPLFIIICFVNMVFYVPAAKIDVAASVGAISLLGALAFQIICSDDLPAIGYMVFSDKIFYLTYFFIFLAILESVLSYYWDPHSKEPNVKDKDFKEFNRQTKNETFFLERISFWNRTKEYSRKKSKFLKWREKHQSQLSHDLEIGFRRYFIISYCIVVFLACLIAWW